MIDSMLEEWRSHPIFPLFEKAVHCSPEERKAAETIADELAKLCVGHRAAVAIEATCIWLWGTAGALMVHGCDPRRVAEYLALVTAKMHDRGAELVDKAHHPAGNA